MSARFAPPSPGWWLFALLLVTGRLSAQGDSVIQIATVEVRAGKVLREADFRRSHGPDSLTLALARGSCFSSILPFTSDAYLRSYSPGGLSTLSLRGTSGSHTPVVWNGLNLRHPMNGTTDYSLYPVWLLEDIAVQVGSGLPHQGSGLLGGGILLSDRLADIRGTGWEVGTVAGSFGTFSGLAKAQYHRGRHTGQLRYVHQQATNDYPLPGALRRRQENAAIRQDAMTFAHIVRPDSSQEWSVHSWLQQADRQIPPTLTEAPISARQQDRTARMVVRWKQEKRKSATEASAGCSLDEILYFSQLTDSTRSRSQLLQSDVRHMRQTAGGGSFGIGYQFAGQRAVAPTTGSRRRELHTFHATLRVPLPWRRFWIQAAVQSVLTADKWQAPGGTIVLQTGLRKHLRWMGSLSRSFSFPTFNDLYWRDAYAEGNPSLRPEQSLAVSTGLTWQYQPSVRKTWNLHAELSANQVRDWILWGQEAQRWRPENKRTVRVHGLAAHGSHTARFSSDFYMRLQAGFAYNRSTVAAVYDPRDHRQVGKQLVYTPVWTGHGTGSLVVRRTALQFQTQWVGRRQTTSDNFAPLSLPPYCHGNLVVQQVLPFGDRWKATLTGTVRNLWNTNMETIAARVMPGRHYQLTLLFGHSR